MKANIIVLDDEINILNSIKRTLRDEFNVFTCEEIKEAKKVLEDENIDVVISDYCLKNSSGVEFLSFVKEKYPYITRIIMTGYNVSDLVKESVNKADISNFIKKPWNNDDLKLAVKNAFKKSRVIKENIGLVNDIKKNKNEITNLYTKLGSFLKTNTESKENTEKDISLNKFIKKASLATNLDDLLNLVKKEFKVFFKDVDLNSFINFDFKSVLGNKEDFNDYIDVINFSIKRILNLNEITNKLNVWEKSFDAISEPLFILDKNFNFINVNKESKKTLLKENDIKNKKCFEVFKDKDFKCEECPIEKVFKTKEANILDHMPCVNDKNIFSYVYPIIKNGEVISAVVYNNNKTSEFKLLKKLIQSEKLAALGALASNIAHEINNPLGGIMAYAQVIKDNVKSEQLLSDLVDIEKTCVRCQEIIKNLLDFSSDQTLAKRELVDLSNLINGTVSLLKSCFKNHKINIDIPENIEIKCNRGQIQQAFFNIINNAIDAMPGGGNINIDVKKNLNFVEVIIQDEGVGISKDDIGQIFDSFYTTKKKGKGTGLGLFVTNSIIKSHKGSIVAKSKLGVGTNFKIKLPI